MKRIDFADVYAAVCGRETRCEITDEGITPHPPKRFRY